LGEHGHPNWTTAEDHRPRNDSKKSDYSAVLEVHQRRQLIVTPGIPKKNIAEVLLEISSRSILTFAKNLQFKSGDFRNI
jgi:hypothetical protein